jgi:hypothetical protein
MPTALVLHAALLRRRRARLARRSAGAGQPLSQGQRAARGAWPAPRLSSDSFASAGHLPRRLCGRSVRAQRHPRARDTRARTHAPRCFCCPSTPESRCVHASLPLSGGAVACCVTLSATCCLPHVAAVKQDVVSRCPWRCCVFGSRARTLFGGSAEKGTRGSAPEVVRRGPLSVARSVGIGRRPQNLCVGSGTAGGPARSPGGAVRPRAHTHTHRSTYARTYAHARARVHARTNARTHRSEHRTPENRGRHGCPPPNSPAHPSYAPDGSGSDKIGYDRIGSRRRHFNAPRSQRANRRRATVRHVYRQRGWSPSDGVPPDACLTRLVLIRWQGPAPAVP